MDKPSDARTFNHVVDWVFDLDNTLYPRHYDLFSQIDWRMTGYVSRLTGLDQDEARLLQKRLYREHGTTLAGLMAEYGIDPHAYLADVHDIDYSLIPAASRSLARQSPRFRAASTSSPMVTCAMR